MRDTSSLEYEEHHDNLYNFTLTSKAQTVERSGSRSRAAVFGSQPRLAKADSIESVISTIPSVKNRKQPPTSLIPLAMNKNALRQSNEQVTLRIVRSQAPIDNDHIKISDEAYVTRRRNNDIAKSAQSQETPDQKKLFNDFPSQKEEEKTTPIRKLLPPQGSAITWSPNRNMFWGRYIDKSGNQRSMQSSTHSQMQNNRPSSEVRQNNNKAYDSKSSENKPQMTVVYDEFKYFSRPFDFNDDTSQKVQIEMIAGGKRLIKMPQQPSSIQKPAKSNSKGGIQESPIGFELSENEHRIFTAFSPGRLSSTRQLQPINAESRKDYDSQMRDMKDHINRLERDLKASEQRSLDMLRKLTYADAKNMYKANSPFQKSNLSNNGMQEDSLLLSEKRSFKKSQKSGKMGPTPTQSVIEEGHIKLLTGGESINNSIINLKIDKRLPLKANSASRKAHNGSDLMMQISNVKDTFNDVQQSPNKDNNEENNPTEPAENESKDEHISFRQDTQNPPLDQGTCQFCECLRQLVFQAKDCIEDLKSEIDEWKDACAQKDAEIRGIYHKLFNDKVGIDKQIDFTEDVRTITYDADKPPSALITNNGGGKNFIAENKKRIRSRSRNNEKRNKTTTSNRSKKGGLKRAKDTLFSDEDGNQLEFLTFSDQAIQTALIEQSEMTTPIVQAHHHHERSVDCELDEMMRMKPTLHEETPSRYDLLQEELEKLKQQNKDLQSEISVLNEHLNQATHQCEVFTQLVKRVKRNNKIVADQQVNDNIVSPISINYSLLEKLHELKPKQRQQLPPTKIARPLKLILNETAAASSNDEQPIKKAPQPYGITKDLKKNNLELSNINLSRQAAEALLQTSLSAKQVQPKQKERPQTAASQSIISQYKALQQQTLSTSGNTSVGTNHSLVKKGKDKIAGGFDHIWREQQEKFKQLQKQQEDYLEILRNTK
ncbi:hypothetical protein FGO68_gene13347 [Halteria grandinella]|uniref:Uncharacterized protein n=1 Tax=Halteria grandinella TaxID=5974 RepID=A0A8J8P1B8_HALGN|nr:hypothetical protein FGO68_gene13347 [Halteria grandinella]